MDAPSNIAPAPAPLATDVNPVELEAFRSAQGGLERAVLQANEIPAEITSQNKGAAAEALAELRAAVKGAEASRLDLTRKFDAAKKRIKAAFDEAQSPASAAAESIADRILAVDERERQEAEDKRRAEEEAARKLQEAENAKAAEEGRASHHIPPPVAREAVRGARGISGRKATPGSELTYEILDESALPERYWKKEIARSVILADVRQGIAIPGVRPFKKPVVRTS